ncbi:hypothetical protein BJF83_03245 [Nocardiopsis sp. CNR-923]|uniref:hypothetical protein n=1 Tax=Nocardiopsis sp. CNR-923 TaxID=1904965 RepID=UPI000966529B|nr:hypothetical protein [Nocardiopsis sp. CNR-923]OLT26740.1 hypothetical protein BJF83_03245 [Nocardiopsis sp. CNR-923]
MPPVSPTSGEGGAAEAPHTDPSVRGEEREPGRRPWPAVVGGLVRDRVVLAAAVVIAVAAALRFLVLDASYFVEDDYLFFAAADTSDLTPEYLFELHKGHFMPGAMFLVYLQTAFWPFEWWVSAGAMLVLQTLSLVVFLRLLWELFGRRWALLVPLTVIALAPLTVPVLGWWAAALNAVPLQLATALALLWTVRYVRTGDQRAGWFAGGSVVFGMLFAVKGMFLPPLLLAVAVAYLYSGSLTTGLRRAWRTHRAFWGAMAGLFAGYTLLYLGRMRASDTGEGAGVPEGEPAFAMLRGLLTEVFPVGALGGPLEWGPLTPAGGLVDPDGWIVLGSWAVLAGIVLGSLWWRRRAWRAWALLLGYLLCADIVPTIIARGRFQDVAAADPRYVADAALVFALCLALAYLPTREERDRVGGGPDAPPHPYRVRPGRGARVSAVLATVVYAGAAGYSTHAYADTLNGDRLQWYLDTVRNSMAAVPEEGGLYSRPVPPDVVLEWNGPRRLSSWALAPLAPPEVAERMRAPEQSDTAYVFNDAGYLVDARPGEGGYVFGPGTADECIETWGGGLSWPVRVYGGVQQVVTLGYTAVEDTEAELLLGDAWLELDLPAAEGGANWYVPVAAPGERLTLHTDPEELCVTWVSVGEMAPSVEGNPWEAE